MDLMLEEADAGGEGRDSTLEDGIDICKCQSKASLGSRSPYLLGGGGFFPILLALLREIGSKSFTVSCDGGGTVKEDECSTSWTAALDS